MGGTPADGSIVRTRPPARRPLVDARSAWHAGVMVHPIVSTPRVEAAMERIRPVAFALPGVVECPSHSSPTFFTADGRTGTRSLPVHDKREWHEGRLCPYGRLAPGPARGGLGRACRRYRERPRICSAPVSNASVI